LEDEIIDKDRVAGPAKKIKYAVKLVAGRAVDDAKLEPDGKAGKIDGKVQLYLAVLDLMPGRRECAILLKSAARLTRLRDSGRRQSPPYRDDVRSRPRLMP
jgi:uncharacterized protein YjbJ (UPF0337 family)